MAEGCLHLHFFLFLQMASQFHTFEDIAQLLRKELLTGQAWKNFVSHVRCGAYPDPEKFDAERANIEKNGPPSQRIYRCVAWTGISGQNSQRRIFRIHGGWSDVGKSNGFEKERNGFHGTSVACNIPFRGSITIFIR
jgi:hypothetical protein